jgi:hypothetical protein
LSRLRLRRDKLQWLETDGEVIALDETTLLYLGVNPSASLLWTELAAGASRDRLVQLLAGTYGLEPERAAADVDAFLAELRRRELLEG